MCGHLGQTENATSQTRRFFKSIFSNTSSPHSRDKVSSMLRSERRQHPQAVFGLLSLSRAFQLWTFLTRTSQLSQAKALPLSGSPSLEGSLIIMPLGVSPLHSAAIKVWTSLRAGVPKPQASGQYQSVAC